VLGCRVRTRVSVRVSLRFRDRVRVRVSFMVRARVPGTNRVWNKVPHGSTLLLEAGLLEFQNTV